MNLGYIIFSSTFSYNILGLHLKQKAKPHCDVLFRQITNLGRSLKSFTNASLNLFWPKENSVGKWLLYLSHTSSKGVQSVPCSPVNEIDHLKDVKVPNTSACYSNCFTQHFWPVTIWNQGLARTLQEETGSRTWGTDERWLLISPDKKEIQNTSEKALNCVYFSWMGVWTWASGVFSRRPAQMDWGVWRSTAPCRV